MQSAPDVDADVEELRAWARSVVGDQCRRAAVPAPVVVVRDDIDHCDAWVVVHRGEALLYVSRPLLHLPAEQVHAVIAHEVGHLRLKHPHHWASGPAADLIPDVLRLLPVLAAVVVWFSVPAAAIILTATVVLAGGWMRIRARYRDEELAADRFAAETGHASGLSTYLATVAEPHDYNGWSWWLRPWGTHPDPRLRQLLLTPWLPMTTGAAPAGPPRHDVRARRGAATRVTW